MKEIKKQLSQKLYFTMLKFYFSIKSHKNSYLQFSFCSDFNSELPSWIHLQEHFTLLVGSDGIVWTPFLNIKVCRARNIR